MTTPQTEVWRSQRAISQEELPFEELLQQGTVRSQHNEFTRGPASSQLWLLRSSHRCPWDTTLSVEINPTVHRADCVVSLGPQTWDGADG